MSRLEKKQPIRCTDLPLNNADICSKLNILSNLLKSCYGPTGRLKQIHNNVGGQVVTSSASSILLPALSSSEPFINIIRTSIINHVSRFSDSGLFAGIMCLSLIKHAQLSCLTKDVCQKVHKYLLELCISYLQLEDCACKVRVDFNSSHCLLRLAHGVISSKPACMLRESEVLHISRLTVQGFLLTVPCVSPGAVKLGRKIIVTIEGLSVMDSAIFPGLLLETPDLSFHQENLSCKPLRTILFSVSLAGDLAELGDEAIEIHNKVADIDAEIMDQLLKIGEQVVKDEVDLFLCQKVIHPILQQYLRDNSIIVIERLGIHSMEPVIQLTGSQPVATLHIIPPSAYGNIKEITIRQFGSKTMLHLIPAEDATVCTLILCHRTETMLNELKAACEKADHVLRLTLKDPFALFGGGCSETHLAAYIRHKSKSIAIDTRSMLGCTQAEYLLAAEGFCRSLDSVAAALDHDGGRSLTDLTHAHHWTLPTEATTEELDLTLSACRCGAVKHCTDLKFSFLNTKCTEFSPTAVRGEAVVLDSFTAKVNGLQVAVETANLALDVQFIIQHTN